MEDDVNSLLSVPLHLLEKSGFLAFLTDQEIDWKDLQSPSDFAALNGMESRRYFRWKKEDSETQSEDGIELSVLQSLKRAGYAWEAEGPGGIVHKAWLPGFYSIPASISLSKLDLYQNGQICGMDISSGYAVKLLNVQPDDHVLDLCCAPGAKLNMIAELIQENGSVTGVDCSSQRLGACRNLVRKHRKTLTQHRCRLFCADGGTFSVGPMTEYVNVQGTEKIFDSRDLQCGHRKRMNKSARGRIANLPTIQIHHPALYDKVLIDAECTHDGSIRHLRKLQTLDEWTEYVQKHLSIKQLQRITILQCNLIRSGFRLLKTNGLLIYSTCSLSMRQNEEIVEEFLLQTLNAKLIPIVPDSAVPCEPGALDGTIRFTPKNGTSGLFVARIQKLRGSEA